MRGSLHFIKVDVIEVCKVIKYSFKIVKLSVGKNNIASEQVLVQAGTKTGKSTLR